MEELTLTDPVIIPAVTTNKYKVSSLTLDMDTITGNDGKPGLINIILKDNNGVRQFISIYRRCSY